jgi:hypothetical protein
MGPRLRLLVALLAALMLAGWGCAPPGAQASPEEPEGGPKLEINPEFKG